MEAMSGPEVGRQVGDGHLEDWLFGGRVLVGSKDEVSEMYDQM